ncbi:MAG: CgeB family protein [Terriglobales bacterium]
MHIRYFAHSWLSDWNHGNAHFLRGLASALARRGHELRLYEAMPEPTGGWSLAHLLLEPGGAAAVAAMRASYPELTVKTYGRYGDVCDWDAELRDAELVLVHEWNEAKLLRWLVEQRRKYGFQLLLHDTHHRAVSDPDMLQRLPLAALDGVLAFGESLRRVYERAGVAHSFTFHEGADVERFRPACGERSSDVIWIGNWGDEERTAALETYLLAPVRHARARTRVYGVRYPTAAQEQLRAQGIAYGGYLPNLDAPCAYSQAALTVHIPRAPYPGSLDGIPTIRVFEALACGMPLLSAPWRDSEALFESGADYLMARTSEGMTATMMQLLRDEQLRTQLSRQGMSTVRQRHSCAHRAEQLEGICRELGLNSTSSAPA